MGRASSPIYQNTPSIATIPSCPNPTCACLDTPAMPEGFEIDHKSKLDMTMAPYDAHLVIRTGTSDWPSKIEDSEKFPEIGVLKRLLTRGGKFAHVCTSMYFNHFQ